MRRNQTPQEDKLWFELRNGKLGVKFKRQNSIGGYITDFYCQKHKFIIEIDGGIQNTKEAQEYDGLRDNYFETLGYRVLRITNEEVDKNLNNVLEKIEKLIRT